MKHKCSATWIDMHGVEKHCCKVAANKKHRLCTGHDQHRLNPNKDGFSPLQLNRRRTPNEWLEHWHEYHIEVNPRNFSVNGMCWLLCDWQGKRKNKYSVSTHGHNGLMFAHRVSMEAKLGKRIPKGRIVEHICDNGHLGCVNPNHLALGTHKTNAKNRSNRVRRDAASHCRECGIHRDVCNRFVLSRGLCENCCQRLRYNTKSKIRQRRGKNMTNKETLLWMESVAEVDHDTPLHDGKHCIWFPMREVRHRFDSEPVNSMSKKYLAHRLYYALKHNIAYDDMPTMVRHGPHCDGSSGSDAPCIAHLYGGVRSDNGEDRAKYNGNLTKAPYVLLMIRRNYKYKDIALTLNMNKCIVTNIAVNKKSGCYNGIKSAIRLPKWVNDRIKELGVIPRIGGCVGRSISDKTAKAIIRDLDNAVPRKETAIKHNVKENIVGKVSQSRYGKGTYKHLHNEWKNAFNIDGRTFRHVTRRVVK